jgi:hypothetical protein
MKSLEELHQQHQGKVSDKWSSYLREYDRLFSEYRDQPINLLEIGIQNGGSLEIWGQYFQNAQCLVGCDINPDCEKLSYDDPRLKVVIGDANTDQSEQAILSSAATFDLIVDDGSHRSSDIIRTFARYFPYLKDGGLFVAEDLHCSYWQEFEGGLFDPNSSIGFFKLLADIINREHWGLDKTTTELLGSIAEHYSVQFDEKFLGHVHSVTFLNSMCVICKQVPQSNALGARRIAGSTEIVVPGHHLLQGGQNQIPDQSGNVFSAKNVQLEALQQEIQVLQQKKQFVEREKQVLQQTKETLEREKQVLQQAKETLEREKESLVNSRSWRITKPLRFISGLFK